MQNLDKHQIAVTERSHQRQMAAAQEQARLNEAIKNAKAQRKVETKQVKVDSKPKGGMLDKLKCCVM